MSSDDLTKPASTEDKLDSLLASSQAIAADVKALTGRVDSLDQKVDARLHDTRPLYEALQDQINKLSERVGRHIQLFEAREQMFTMQLQLFGKKLDRLAADILHARAEQSLVEDRLTKLEDKIEKPS
jgi:peptidoglycan hydrolase CwlO-like protein